MADATESAGFKDTVLPLVVTDECPGRLEKKHRDHESQTEESQAHSERYVRRQDCRQVKEKGVRDPNGGKNNEQDQLPGVAERMLAVFVF